MKTSFRLTALAGLILVAAALQAASPHDTLPPGFGRYIMVLKTAGERRDTPKTITEPDVAKAGGNVLSRKDNRRLIDLPLAAARNLRDNPNVAYLQRVWMGESLDTWDERDTSHGGSLKAQADDTAGNDLTWSTGAFGYDPSGNIKAIGNDTYTYDTSSRLVKAVVNGQTESYAYDSFGNLTQKTIAGQSPTVPAIDSTSNRLAGEAYDAAGNVTSNGSKIGYIFDSAGSMAELDTNLGQQRRMIYTADDERIGEMLDSNSIRWKIRDFNTGQIQREFYSAGTPSISWEWTEDYYYAGGTPVAAEMESYWGGKRHLHLDHLGSVRMITNDARLRYSRNDFLPFGMEQSSSVQEATNFGFFRSDPVKFTGHEREYYGILNVDNTDYLDYMHARYYNPAAGRFLSVDPLGGNAYRPLTWNRYAYTLDNPLVFTDPAGLYPCPVVGSDGKEHPGECVDVTSTYDRDLAGTNYIQRQLTRDRERTRRRAGRGDDFAALELNYSREMYNPQYTTNIEANGGEFAIVAPLTGLLRSIGMAGGEIGLKAATEEAGSFFDGATFNLSGKADVFHNFPEGVMAFEDAGSVTTIPSAGGTTSQMLRIPGGYMGKEGVFEFIKIHTNEITHYFFNTRP